MSAGRNILAVRQVSPSAWAAFVARVVVSLMFFMAGIWKVFTVGALEHARNVFVVPYQDSILPAWSLWASGAAIPFVELVAGGLLLVGWKRFPAAVGLGGVLIVVTFGHLLAEPLFAFDAHVVPRTLLLVVALVLRDEDRLSLDAVLARRRSSRSAAPRR